MNETSNAAALFDPFSIESVPTGELQVRNEAGVLTGMVIMLAGPEHPDRKKRLFARQRRLRAAVFKTGKVPQGDPEEDAAEQLDELVANTLGWTGASVPYSPQAARELYASPKRRWLRDQVQEALDDQALFTRSSAQS